MSPWLKCCCCIFYPCHLYPSLYVTRLPMDLSLSSKEEFERHIQRGQLQLRHCGPVEPFIGILLEHNPLGVSGRSQKCVRDVSAYLALATGVEGSPLCHKATERMS